MSRDIAAKTGSVTSNLDIDLQHHGNAQEKGGSRISVEGIILGDYRGLAEKLYMFVTSELIRKQTEEGATRVKLFLHSLEACEMLR